MVMFETIKKQWEASDGRTKEKRRERKNGEVYLSINNNMLILNTYWPFVLFETLEELLLPLLENNIYNSRDINF